MSRLRIVASATCATLPNKEQDFVDYNRIYNKFMVRNPLHFKAYMYTNCPFRSLDPNFLLTLVVEKKIKIHRDAL